MTIANVRSLVGMSILLLGALWWPRAAHTAGPLLVNDAGEPLVWVVRPIPFSPDRGPLGVFENGDAVANVKASLAVWSSVETASVQFTDAGPLPVDVGKTTYQGFLGACEDGVNPIIFDDDGTIVDDLFGVDARNNILGFAGPECGTLTPPIITGAAAVLNARWIDGVATTKNPEIALSEFDAIMVHEFGHLLNLDHSQVNLIEAFDSNQSNDSAVATMFPFLVNAREALTLHLDDRVSVSSLYPSSLFDAQFGKIAGHVLRRNGTAFQGGYVVARNVDAPRTEAVGYASGTRFTVDIGASSFEGAFEIPGLPAGQYTVEVEPVDPRFRSGSGVGPLDPPVELPGPSEFYSGAIEAPTNPPDDPLSAAVVPVQGGATITGVDIVLNRHGQPQHDDCMHARVISGPAFAERVSTVESSDAVSDPVQSCTFGGASANGKSVWYRVTPSMAGRVSVETVGSTYDTVLTVYTGDCGVLHEIGCNDDAADSVQSSLSFAVSPGVTYLIEVAEFRGSEGGTLQLSMDLTPLACGNGVIDPGEACDEGAANQGGGCCDVFCRVQDADQDGVCDGRDVCPEVADDQADVDSDGIGDACDLCRTAPGRPSWSKAKLRLYRANDGIAGNDRLLLNGALSIEGDAFGIDLTTDGALIELRSANRTRRFYASLPPLPGPWGQLSKGWEYALGTFSFLDASPGGTDAVNLMHVAQGPDGRADLRIRGHNGSFAVQPSDLPLSMTVVLGGAGAGSVGQCGEVRFGSCKAMKTKIACDYRRKF